MLLREMDQIYFTDLAAIHCRNPKPNIALSYLALIWCLVTGHAHIVFCVAVSTESPGDEQSGVPEFTRMEAGQSEEGQRTFLKEKCVKLAL